MRFSLTPFPKPTQATTTEAEEMPPSIKILMYTVDLYKGSAGRRVFIWNLIFKGKEGLRTPRFIKNSQRDLTESRSILINSLEVFEGINCNWQASLRWTGSTWQSPDCEDNINGECFKCLMMEKVRKPGGRCRREDPQGHPRFPGRTEHPPAAGATAKASPRVKKTALWPETQTER